jgi:5-formyltetrahydrofolate cyclo-ligase
MAEAQDDERRSLRRQVISRRAALDRKTLDAAAGTVRGRLATTPEFQRAQRISAYWPVRGEMDVRPVIETAIERGKAVYLPVLASRAGVDEAKGLVFAPYGPDVAMVADKYGIPEPDVGPERLIEASELDLAIVPLVLFDSAGHRVGMGGGYYDRAFAFRNEAGGGETPVLVGAAHSFQRVDALPPEPWDVALDIVVTDDGLWRAGGSHNA